MVDDEWVKIARVEDTMVAELLLRLKGVGVGVGVGVSMMSAPPTAAMASTSKQKPAVLIEWRVRQRRSKAVTGQQQQQQQMTKDQAPRDSPSTPLSFSGGATTSVSFGGGGGGGGGGIGGGGPEEAESSEISAAESAPKTCEMTRSKAVRSSESNTIRKSQKKKTLAELKAEDEYLARERVDLQRELKSVRDNLEIERAKNDNFKRIKLQQEIESAPVTFQAIVATNNDTLIIQHSSSAAISSSGPKIEEPANGGFVLPDLNLPLEDNFNLLY